MILYTDGACLHNGQPNSKASYAVVCPETNYKLVGSGEWEGKQTCNTGELLGIYYAILYAIKQNKNTLIVSDSLYAINSVTKWKLSAKKKNFSLIYMIRDLLHSSQAKITFEWVKGHQVGIFGKHVYGNALADQLANSYLGIY